MVARSYPPWPFHRATPLENAGKAFALRQEICGDTLGALRLALGGNASGEAKTLAKRTVRAAGRTSRHGISLDWTREGGFMAKWTISPGDWSHIDVPTRDVQRSHRFYGEVFGRRFDESPASTTSACPP